MARGVLIVLMLGSLGWALTSYFAGSYLPDWLALSGPVHGEKYIEALAYNVGRWGGLGIVAFFGALVVRLRLAALLAFIVVAAGLAGARLLAIFDGAEPEIFSGVALALEVTAVVAATAGYISEKARLAGEAREQKRAEKAALEAALKKEHEESAAAAQPVPAPSLPSVD